MKFIKLVSLVFSVLFVFSVISSIVYADDGVVEVPDIKVIINGKNVIFSDVIISSNGRTLLPLRALLTNLGVQNDDEHIIWNASEKSVTIIKESIKIKLVQGNNLAYVNDIPITLDVPPIGYSKNGRTYIPARFVAQSLGKAVDWDSNTKSVIINDPNFVTVETAEELIAAIASNTSITLKSGVYNLSKVKQEYSEGSVFWEEVFDGNQLILKGIKNLTLQGEGDKPAEIVVEPRYANVFNFKESTDITIRNIKAGHTPEQGECAGGVLLFEDCSNITILESDLYGCGIEGLTLQNTQFLTFANSVIHDCNTEIMALYNSKNISFYNSAFYDNEGYSYGVTARDNSSLTFEDCDFNNNLIWGGIFFDLSLSKMFIKDTVIQNNSFQSLSTDTPAIKMDNLLLKDNANLADILREATKSYANGEYEEAIEYLDEVLEINPDIYNVYPLKGDSLYFLGRYEEAIECYDKALKISQNANTYYGKAKSLVKLNRFSDAISNLKTSIELFPAYIENIKTDPDFDKLRGMSEFMALIK